MSDSMFKEESKVNDTPKNSKNKPSSEKLEQAMMKMISIKEEESSADPWIRRYQDLQEYKFDVVRDGSDEYFNALTEAILAVTRGDYGSIDYKGYKIYYTDTPRIKSISVVDDHVEYSYEMSFQCDALRIYECEEYHSEDERKAFLDPASDLFHKTVELLDKEIEYLDEGIWIKNKKTLNIYDFKDYSYEELRFEGRKWDEREIDSSSTFSYLMKHAFSQIEGLAFTEKDFNIFAEIIRRMVFFADYGKNSDFGLVDLQGYIWYDWKPETKRDRYIWRCMDEFGQGDLPDRLLDNCTIYYLLDDPRGWEAVAYLFPILSLAQMCQDYEPDHVKEAILKIFDIIEVGGYRERIEKLIEEDRVKASSISDEG